MIERSFKRPPYQQLSAETSEIRTLEILPGTGIISCRLHHAIISNAQFEAISYAWTKASESDPFILVNAHSMQVRQSLADALLRFRRPDVSRTVWIDGICIDQEDVSERNRQVQLMRAIYIASWRTLIWLGPSDSTTAQAFAFAKERAISAQHGANETPKSTGVFLTQDHMYLPKKWFALSNLYTRNWFQRAWIVQEVTFSSNATVVCGEYEMDWTDLVIGNQDIQFASSYLRHLGTGGSQIPDSSEDLTAILARNRQRQATEPVDKVYAFLGLVDVGKRYGIMPDYNRSELDLLLRLTLDSITTRGDLGIFSASTQQHSEDLGRPSWVFSSSYSPSRDTLASESFAWRAHMWGGSYFPTFNACRDSKARPVYDERTRSLTLQGTAFDVIVDVGKQREGYRQIVDSSWLSMLQKWSEHTTETICYVNWRRVAKVSESQDARRVFWETTNGGVLDDYLEQTGRDWEFIDTELRFLWQLPDFLSEFCPLFHMFCLWFLVRGLILEFLGYNYLTPVSQFGQNTTAGYNRRIFRTRHGAIGIGPNTIRVGDYITILDGGKVPIVLRNASSGQWTLIGESYVHGIMQGEAFDSKQSVPFVLV